MPKAVKGDLLSLSDVLRVESGFVLADLDPGSTPGFDGDKKDGKEELASHSEQLGDWQERMFAESTVGSKRRLLLVIQGMDTAGKGGIMRHVVGAMDPEGVRATAFKQPTPEEQEHDFLWRIERALPAPGKVGVFDRSHYEDVLVVRVHHLVEQSVWATRYAQINAWERRLAETGTTIVKVMLHIGRDEQRDRLAERLERPDKFYKYNPGDVTERGFWDSYMEAYQAVLDHCSTPEAPWHVVPANHKWYARLAVQRLLLDAFQIMRPQWPAADFDVEVEKRRLAES